VANLTSGFMTERLVARLWMGSDAPQLFAMMSRRDVSKWTSIPDPMTEVSQARERIALWARAIEGHDALGIWAIISKSSQAVSGMVLLRPLVDSSSIEIGWSLHPDHWGRGYATEAAGAALAHAFAHGYQRVVAIMRPDNARSAAVCHRLGMAELGVMQDPWHGTPAAPTSLMFEACADTWVSRPGPART
jgi:RimJ/RimL family protein N-acetyltransferase